jgi:hypothetical protein
MHIDVRRKTHYNLNNELPIKSLRKDDSQIPFTLNQVMKAEGATMYCQQTKYPLRSINQSFDYIGILRDQPYP